MPIDMVFPQMPNSMDADAGGVKVVQGPSAYDIAVLNGFVGTEQEWLASLIGPPGPIGETGQTGATGEIGATGPGVPPGGSPGQLLTKSGEDDYDAQWKDAAEAGIATTDYVDNAIGGAIGRGY